MRISTGTGKSETLVTLKKLLISPFTGNAQAASVCVTLALIEAVEKGEIVHPKESASAGVAKFNWGESGTDTTSHSIGFTINNLLGTEIMGENEKDRRKSFSDLVQDTLIPRGVEIIESKRYDDLCDWFIQILEADGS